MLKPTKLTIAVHKIEDRHAYRDKHGRIYFSVLRGTPKEILSLHKIVNNFPDGSGKIQSNHRGISDRQKHFCEDIVKGYSPVDAYKQAFNSSKNTALTSAHYMLNKVKIKKFIKALKGLKSEVTQ